MRINAYGTNFHISTSPPLPHFPFSVKNRVNIVISYLQCHNFSTFATPTFANMEYKDSKQLKQLLALLFTGVLMGALDISIVGPALPSISKQIAIEQRLIGWVLSIYVLFNLVGISLFARLSDIYGRRNIYITAISVFAIGSVMVALSSDFVWLLVGRGVQGFGASGIFPVASAVVGDVFPPEKRGRYLGMLGAVFGIAFIIGPVLAGVVMLYFSWHVLFLINIPIAVVIIYASTRIMPAEKHNPSASLDWRGILLLGAMLGSLSYGVNMIDRTGFVSSITSPAVYPFFVSALLFFIGFIRSQRRTVHPIVNLSLFGRRQIRLVAYIAVGTGLLQSTFVFVPDYITRNFGVEPAHASFMLAPIVFATAIGSPLFGRMIDKVGSKWVIVAGLLLSTMGFWLIRFDAVSLVAFYGAGVLIGLSLSILAGSALRYIMLNEVSAGERAATQGLVTIFISVGQIVGSALIGVALAGVTGIAGYLNLFFVLSGIMLFLALLGLNLKPKHIELVQGK